MRHNSIKSSVNDCYNLLRYHVYLKFTFLTVLTQKFKSQLVIKLMNPGTDCKIRVLDLIKMYIIKILNVMTIEITNSY